jgi:hypothetical protein
MYSTPASRAAVAGQVRDGDHADPDPKGILGWPVMIESMPTECVIDDPCTSIVGLSSAKFDRLAVDSRACRVEINAAVPVCTDAS